MHARLHRSTAAAAVVQANSDGLRQPTHLRIGSYVVYAPVTILPLVDNSGNV
jgi:hypothetical protein